MLAIDPNLIMHHDKLVVATSGGMDSMVLLHFLHELQPKLQLKLVVAHVNHHTRPATDSEEAFVKQISTLYGLPFESYHFQHDYQTNFHDTSRLARMAFFQAVAKKHHCEKIVLAHHADDLAETILMRISRGSSFHGYAGMQAKTKLDEWTIIRPFLHVAKADILAYQAKHQIEYMEDESNQADTYTRNRFRHHIIPLIRNENPAYVEKFNQFSTYIQEASELIHNLAVQFVQDNVSFQKDSAKLLIPVFCKLERGIQRAVLVEIIGLLSNHTVEVSFTQMNELLQLSLDQKPKKEIDIDEELIVLKSYDWLSFHQHKPDYPTYEYQISAFTELDLPNGAHLSISQNNSNLRGKIVELWYNDLDLIFPLTIRNRRMGDKISFPYGTKKLKDLFIEKKVPHALREELPLVYSPNGTLLWIPSYYQNDNTSGRNPLFLAYWKG